MKEFIQTSIAENGSNSFLRGGSQKYPAGPERRLPKDGSKKRRAGGGQADLPDPEVVERIKAHLDVLGLALDASPSAGDIKRAYRELALKCHPDKTGNDEALSETFKKINEAHEALSDEKVKEAFDVMCQAKARREDQGHKKRKATEMKLARCGPGSDLTTILQNYERELARMRKEQGSSVPSEPTRPSVLLVDEVDVFFGDGFYGQPYQPSVNIDTDHGDGYKLLRHVWEEREHYRKTKACVFEGTMVKRPEVKQLQKEFPNLTGDILKR